ncbi:uncharacterized protein LOC144702194 [Wolffia australiana]
MEEARIILRRAVFSFFQGYQSFSSGPALLAMPVSLGLLLSGTTALTSSTVMAAAQTRLSALFAAAGLPTGSSVFSFSSLKLAQTAVSSVLILPLVLTFLVFAQARVIALVFGKTTNLYLRLLRIHLCLFVVVLAANGAAFVAVSAAVGCAAALGAESERLVMGICGCVGLLYVVLLAKSLVVGKLAMVVAGAGNCGSSFCAVVRACLLLRRREAAALWLAVFSSLTMAGAEAVFQVRVAAKGLTPATIGEATTISYIYSLLLVLDTLISCVLFKSCQVDELRCICSYGIECKKAGGGCFRSRLLLEQP